MSKTKQIPVGTRFGSWTVISYVGEKGSGRNSYWLCQCDCGNQHEVVGSNLRTGGSTRCQTCAGKLNGRVGLYNKGNQPHLYMIKCGDYFKIGVSADPIRRIKDMRTNNPYPIETLYIGYNEGHEEAFWHELFKHRHHQGEWFNGSCEYV